MAVVAVDHLTKRYGTLAALDDVSLNFADGEFFGLLGPSGSGKTTLLRSIAGFITPDAGTISFDGERVETVPVNQRGIGMVFQSYALFPHLTVSENIAFGLDVKHVPKPEVATRVAEMLDFIQLEGLGDRKPRQLSGGQQQRVALARSLATKPRVLLLDEPLGALDRRLRQEMQVELLQIQRTVGITTIFVTHDQEEAMALSDRIAIIDKGKLIQVGPPRAVYERPKNVFAARFLGDANVFEGTAVKDGTRLADGSVILSGTATTVAIVRPEKVDLVARTSETQGAPKGMNRLQGTVMQAVFSGASTTYRIAVEGAGLPVLAVTQNRSGAPFEKGAQVAVTWAAADTVAVEP